VIEIKSDHSHGPMLHQLGDWQMKLDRVETAVVIALGIILVLVGLAGLWTIAKQLWWRLKCAAEVTSVVTEPFERFAKSGLCCFQTVGASVARWRHRNVSYQIPSPHWRCRALSEPNAANTPLAEVAVPDDVVVVAIAAVIDDRGTKY
jgi:hypothetical protein